MKKVYYFDCTMPEYSGCGKHNAAAILVSFAAALQSMQALTCLSTL